MISFDTYPTVHYYLPKKSPRLRIILPMEKDEGQRAKFLHAMAQWKIEPKIEDNGDIRISTFRRDYVMDVLRSLYVGVWEEREYEIKTHGGKEDSEGCDSTECLEANESECVCKCLGKYHQSGREWKRNVGERAVKSGVAIYSRWHSGWYHEFTGTAWIGPEDDDLITE